jgi:phosphatidylglycerol:prolipoprotein diacylglycerol transferase
MQPELLFHLFGTTVQIQAYNLFAILGALTGAAAAFPLLKREGLPVWRALGLLAGMAAAFLIGARLFNYLINPAAYGGPLRIYTLRLAGLSLYGGIAGSLAVLLSWARVTRTAAWPLLDALVLPGGLAFALARVGCYLNGCCVGKVANSRWGVDFPLPENGQELFGGFFSWLGQSGTTVNLYPTQLYELSLALLGLIPVLWLYFRRRLPSGAAFLLYGTWFSALRLAVLPLRSLTYARIVVNLFYPLFYIGLILGGLFLFIRLYKKDKSTTTIL